jgi:phosphotriesterase-related protein
MTASSKQTVLRTITGDVPIDQLGMILPHEHIFTDLRGPQTIGYAQGDPQAVGEVVLPFLRQAWEGGVTALVECSTVGVGRNVAVLVYVAQNTALRIVAPTGVYREAFIPSGLHDICAEELAQTWIKELTDGIEDTPIKAGFIKIAVSDDEITTQEMRNLKAAALASQATNAVVASHTIVGDIARQEIDLLEKYGLDLRRFIWVHAHASSTPADRLEVARRGAWIELDVVGAPWIEQNILLRMTLDLIEAGYASQVLLSHDAGWYQPGNPGGLPQDGFRGYTSLTQSFLPELRVLGVDDFSIDLLTKVNPQQAFGLKRK